MTNPTNNLEQVEEQSKQSLEKQRIEYALHTQKVEVDKDGRITKVSPHAIEAIQALISAAHRQGRIDELERLVDDALVNNKTDYELLEKLAYNRLAELKNQRKSNA